MDSKRVHTTIGLKRSTKQRLDAKRAPGQCYDGFLCQLMDLWDEIYVDPLRTPLRTPQFKEEVKA